MRILVIIPAYNEAENIGGVVRELKKDFSSADILVVNDCSRDNTLNVLRELDGITYLALPCNLGYAGALQSGFKYAVRNNYDYVIQFDGDGQHIAGEAARLYELALRSGSDITMGSRFKFLSGYKHSFFRKIGTKFFSVLIKRISGVEITDPTSGFQVLDAKVFTHYAGSYPEYPDANLIIEMLLRGYTILEEQVEMRARIHGESMHSGVFKPVKYMIKMVYAIFLILVSREKYKKSTGK